MEQIKQGAGTATAVDLLSSRESMQGTENSLKELESEIANVRETLCISLGSVSYTHLAGLHSPRWKQGES